MTKHYVMSPVHSRYLLQQLIAVAPKSCEPTSLECLCREINNWRCLDLGLGFKPEKVAFVSGSNLNRFLSLKASPEGQAYDLAVLSDSPEYLYRLLRRTQDIEMDVDLWVDHISDNWRDICKKGVNNDHSSADDLMFSATITDLIRDNIARRVLKRLPRLVQFPGYDEEFGNYPKEVMAEAKAIHAALQKR